MGTGRGAIRAGGMAIAAAALAMMWTTALLAQSADARPEDGGSSDLAKQAQNPVADLISVPFQNNLNFRVGPHKQQQDILNIQPVIPIKLNEDWNLITRWILPVISQPPLTVTGDREFGLGDLNPTFFLSPSKPTHGIIWGIGPTFLVPTATDDALGARKWGAGPAAVVLTTQGPWVIGALVSQLWSFEGGPQAVNQTTIQPFVNYNFPGGWYLTTSPIATANWEAKPQDRWTVPVGGGFGRVFKIGKQPVNMQLAAYYNVVRPTNGPDWQLRAQVQLLFPK